MSRPERNLKRSPAFGAYESASGPHALAEMDFPFPEPGEPLLSQPIGSEKTIRFYDDFGLGKLEQLSYFAMFYEDRARELVRQWLQTSERPENFVYPVGFLYRHSIELNMKAAIARSPWFKRLEPILKKEVFRKHDLSVLWRLLKPIVAEYMDPEDIEPFEKQLAELQRLDATSQGFRYPFSGIDSEGNPGPLLEGLVGKSFDNLVWVLDGMAQWLGNTADVESEYREARGYLGSP